MQKFPFINHSFFFFLYSNLNFFTKGARMPISQHLSALLKKPYKYTQNFLWNIRDSFRFSIRTLAKDMQSLQREAQNIHLDEALAIIENLMYEIENSGIKRPKMKGAQETVSELLSTNKSIARIGDGEMSVANGDDVPFQKADKELAVRLQKIISTPQENLLVGLCPIYNDHIKRNIINDQNRHNQKFALYAVPKIRKKFDRFINYEVLYWNASIVHKEFILQWREFFVGKKLVLTGCKEAFDSYEFNIFDTAAQLCYEFVPNKHAFSEYESILARLKAYDKNFVHILMCGPTACILAADLCVDGRRALDLGHLAKHYDWYKRGIDMSSSDEKMIKFYAPDE